MADTQQIIRRLQAEGLVAYESAPGQVTVTTDTDKWQLHFDSIIVAAMSEIRRLSAPQREGQ